MKKLNTETKWYIFAGSVLALTQIAIAVGARKEQKDAKKILERGMNEIVENQKNKI